jgi:hypothetical protein
MSHEHICQQEETIGKFKEFMATTKGLKSSIFLIAIAIVTQVAAFLFMWGGLTEKVNKDNDQIWEKNTPCITENTRNIDKILAKMDTIAEIRGYKGDKGEQGMQGLPGKNAK